MGIESRFAYIRGIDPFPDWPNLHPSPWARGDVIPTPICTDDFERPNVVNDNLHPMFQRPRGCPAR